MIKVRCLICQEAMPGQMTEWPDYPFCSARCRKIDLGRWLGERYRIAAPGEPEDESSPSSDDTDLPVP